LKVEHGSFVIFRHCNPPLHFELLSRSSAGANKNHQADT